MFGDTDLEFRQDLLADNPEDKISIVSYHSDPWLEFRELTRNTFFWIFGVEGATVRGILFTVWLLRKRYY
jgi:hypothetical protein